MPEWEPDLTIEPPAWLVEGARVRHNTFGPGRVGRVATYKDVPTVWIDFDDGQTKGLALEFGLQHLAPESA
jgi:transcription elongation factor GreA-like protein